ncbi:MAG: MutS family DNA mismatch repair protein [Nitrospiraceae bacterium]
MLVRLNRLHARGKQASAQLTRWRLGIFVAGVVCSVLPYKLGWYHVGNTALGAFLLTFFIVARYHNRVEDRMHRIRLYLKIKQAHLGRVRLDWNDIPPRFTPLPERHPYAADLDLIGQHSLLHLIDTTVSSNGRERLASWLLDQPPVPDDWSARQARAKELAPLALLRDRLALEAMLIDEAEINGQRLHAVLQTPVGFSGLIPLLITQSLLALTTLVLLVVSALNWLPNYWMLSFGAYALLYMMTDRGEELLEHAVSVHLQLEKLGAVLAVLERRSFNTTPALTSLCAPFTAAGTHPAASIRQAARVMHAVSIKAHPLVHLAINAIGPWDLWYTLRLQRLQRKMANRLPLWLNAFAELEAASALGAFAYLHPTYSWPAPITTADDDSKNGMRAAISMDGLGHPLLHASQRITNDLELSGVGRILLVTGSNMSGKSTFLRTIGINICLAQAGAPVCAVRLAWSWVRLACCIRIDDSLEAGLSFFYAEVKRLKHILTATQDRSNPPVLFLIDEIFKGTNNRERLVGSRAYITALASGNGFGLVTTHDLELTDIEKKIPGLTNAHFQETVEAKALKFDFRLRPGPSPTTNALKIMELEGLPVPKQTEDEA